MPQSLRPARRGRTVLLIPAALLVILGVPTEGRAQFSIPAGVMNNMKALATRLSPLSRPAPTPPVIQVGRQTSVVVTSKSRVVWVGQARPTLMRLDAAGKPSDLLGVMHDDGLNGDAVRGDSVYTARVSFTPAGPETIRVRVLVLGGDDVQAPPSSPDAFILATQAAPGKTPHIAAALKALQNAIARRGTHDSPNGSHEPQQSRIAESGTVGLRVPIPPNWGVNNRVLAAGGPISLNTFNAQYGQGGIPPSGGAEIDVTSVRSPQETLAAYAEGELVDTDIYSRAAPSISGHRTYWVRYRDQMERGYETENEVVYIVGGGFLYKFYLTYLRGDPAAKRHHADFERVVREALFMRKEPR